jgi:eukaryotic-like serine/threonine-protein kinase
MSDFLKFLLMSNFVKFMMSKAFLKHIIIITGTGVFITIAVFIGLRIYTKHDKSYAVPDLRGLTVSEAEMVTRARRLNFKVADSVYISQEERGRVIDQNPSPNFRVKENRTIFLTINAMNPERVPMPDVTGVSLRQARAIIETQGLQIGKLIYVPDLAVNNVLNQQYHGKDIRPGEMVIRGESIDLVLGEGLSSRTTHVPDLLMLNQEAARNIILQSSLNIGATIYDATVKTQADSINAFIWRQRPEYSENLQIRLGSDIDLWLSLDSTLIHVPAETDIHIRKLNDEVITIR